MHENLYFETIKNVLDKSIQSLSHRTGKPLSEIDAEISAHIERTSNEHRQPDPNINYNDPLCRLGYLFTHVGANAALFEQSIRRCDALSRFIVGCSNNSMALCTVGGGPGTELLGLTKYFISEASVPSSVHFTVLDSVPHWAETWEIIASECQNLLTRHIGRYPVIHKAFQPMDVVDPLDYANYAWLFEKIDIFVYNYLVSENQVRLQGFEGALSDMVEKAKAGCFFVVIDRLERMTSFRSNVRDVFDRSGLDVVCDFEIGGVMSDDESALGDYLRRFDRRPRRWFRTRWARHPTVFAIVAQKPYGEYL